MEPSPEKEQSAPLRKPEQSSPPLGENKVMTIIEEIKSAKPDSVASIVREGSPEVIEMPAGKKRCPKGYSSVSVSNRKMCKKNTTMKKR